MKSQIDLIEIEKSTIGDLLKFEKTFVPPNQRDYAWKDKHVKELYTDLQKVIDDPNAVEHFLGSIVMIRDTEDKRLMIVDGQQRLTTSLILLAAIRDFHDEHGDLDGARNLEREFLFSSSYTSGITRHLDLNVTDAEYFYERVVLPKSDSKRKEREKEVKLRPSHNRINKAAKIAKETVKTIVRNYSSADRFVPLKRWVDFLAEGARVIWVKVPDESAAYMIFETMNDRGLALSATDLIKNYLLGLAGQSKIEIVKQNWAQMMGTLDTVGDSDIVKTFVRHFWISQNGLVQTAQLFASIKYKVRDSENAVKLSEDLAHASILYAALLNPSHPMWNKYGVFSQDIRDSLSFLKLVGVYQVRPLLLNAIDNFSNKEVSELCKKIVSWVIRLIFAGTQGTGELEQIYSDIALKIFNGDLKKTADVSAIILKKVPNDSQFEADFAEAKVSRSDLARWYLRQLEIATNPTNKSLMPNPNTASVNLEHVMPEDSDKHWGHIDKDLRLEYLQRIGNQAIMDSSDNSRIGNEAFNVKKTFLQKSAFALTKSIAKYPSWGISEIEVHQRKLAKIAIKHWKR